MASVATVDRLVTEPGTIPLRGSFTGTADWAAIGFEILPAIGPLLEYGQGPIRLSGSGLPQSGGTELTLVLTGAPPSSTGFLLVSPTRAEIPVNGSLILYAAPPFFLQRPLDFDDQGRASLTTSIPLMASASYMYLQALASAGTVHSNGLRVSVPQGPQARKKP